MRHVAMIFITTYTDGSGVEIAWVKHGDRWKCVYDSFPVAPDWVGQMFRDERVRDMASANAATCQWVDDLDEFILWLTERIM